MPQYHGNTRKRVNKHKKPFRSPSWLHLLLSPEGVTELSGVHSLCEAPLAALGMAMETAWEIVSHLLVNWKKEDPAKAVKRKVEQITGF